MIMVQGKNNTSQQVLSAHFNYLLLGIPAFTAPCREPTPAAHLANLHTLKSNTHLSWEHTKTYQLVEKNPGDVSFESVESLFRQKNRAAPPLEM